MKRLGFVARIGAFIAAPLVPIVPKIQPNVIGSLATGTTATQLEYAVVSEQAQAAEGVWLRFRYADGAQWPGVFHAMNTTEERLADLSKSIDVRTVEWWKGGELVHSEPISETIATWEQHIITGIPGTPDGGATFILGTP